MLIHKIDERDNLLLEQLTIQDGSDLTRFSDAGTPIPLWFKVGPRPEPGDYLQLRCLEKDYIIDNDGPILANRFAPMMGDDPEDNNVKGHVVVLGLGVGALAVKLAQLDIVTRVSVVENNDAIIELFNANIFRTLPWAIQKKVHVVPAEYMKRTTMDLVKRLGDEVNAVFVQLDLFADELRALRMIWEVGDTSYYVAKEQAYDPQANGNGR